MAARTSPKSKFTWAYLGGVGLGAKDRRDVVIRCKETTREYLGLRRCDDRFIGEKIAGTRDGRGMRGSEAGGDSYKLILNRPATLKGIKIKTMGLTVPTTVTVRELVFWFNRNSRRVDGIITPRGVFHSTETGLKDELADFAEDGLDLARDLIPNFGTGGGDIFGNIVDLANDTLADSPVGVFKQGVRLLGTAADIVF